MKLRDLTKRQLYNLRRRCDAQRKAWSPSFFRAKENITIADTERAAWNRAFNAGLIAGLEFADNPGARCICSRVPPYTGCPVHA